MAILCTLTFNDPYSMGVYPPNVLDSDWFKSSSANFTFIGTLNDGSTSFSFTQSFADETALNDFLSTYTLNDPALLADIAAWKTAHNISYETKFTDDSGNELSYPPFIV